MILEKKSQDELTVPCFLAKKVVAPPKPNQNSCEKHESIQGLKV